MSETIYSPFAASGALETFVPSEEDFIVNTQLLGMPSQPATQAPAAPRVDSQFRTYAPPPSGSFDPYTAGITGNIPSFFSYREPPPPALTPAPAAPVIPGDGGGGDSGGLGTGNVNMGGQMAGSIDLGPNPGVMDRGFGQQAYGQLGQTVGTLAGLATGVPGLGLGLGALGTLADVRGLNAELGMLGLPQEVAFGPAFAANITSGMLGTPAAAQFGNVIGFDAFAEAPISAFSSRGAPAASAAQGVSPADFGGFSNAAAQAAAQAVSDAISMGFGPESPGYGDFGGFGNAEAQAAAQSVSDAIGAGFGPESAGYGAPSEGGPGGEGSPGSGGDASQGGSAGEASSDGAGGMGWKAGGLIPSEEELAFAGGGLVPLAGGGKIAIGPGGGLDDLIPTSINGRRAAALSDGEFVIPADVVSMMGDGSSNAGARRLYDLVRQVRDVKTGTTKQAGPLPVGDILKRSMGR